MWLPSDEFQLAIGIWEVVVSLACIEVVAMHHGVSGKELVESIRGMNDRTNSGGGSLPLLYSAIYSVL